MTLNTKLVVFGAPLLGVLMTGLTLSASALSPSGAPPKNGLVLPFSFDDEDGEDGEEADEPREMDLRDVVPMAQLSLSKAVSLALAAQPGAAVEAGIEGEFDEEGDLSVFYEVMVVGRDKNLHEVKLSHLDGSVISNSIEDGEEEMAELIGFNEALRHSDRTLTQLIASAGDLVKGQAASASLEIDDEGPECEVLIVNGRYLVDVDVEARAGHVVEVELAGLSGDSDDECGYRDEDDDGEHWDGHEDDDDVRSGGHDDDDDHEGDDEDEEDDD